MKHIQTIARCALLLGTLAAASAPGLAQDQAGAEAPSLASVAEGLRTQLEEQLAELSRVRAAIGDEQVPLHRRLNELERDVLRQRAVYQERSRSLDASTLALATLTKDLARGEAETAYLGDLLNDYIRNFEARLHITEVARYREAVRAARLAPENAALSAFEVFDLQAELLDTSLGRLFDAVGGARFVGTAVGDARVVREGSFVLLGPSAIFRSDDGSLVGSAEERLSSLEPTVVPFVDPINQAAAAALVESGAGRFPFDATLGGAHKVEEANETIVEHARKGGVIMVPILGMAALALLVALYKWLRLSLVRLPSKKNVAKLLRAVREHDAELAAAKASALGGPVGRMLSAGVEHLDEPKELIEEVLFEKVLTTKVSLHSMLPFIAICAAASPLLGLLGTVQGIIETFKQITVHGSGDVKVLSAGISKALITTEYGLIVAIPALLVNSFLARKARSVVNKMETTGIAFLNEIMRARAHTLVPAAAQGEHPGLPGGVKAAVAAALAHAQVDLDVGQREQLTDRLERALTAEA